MSILFDFDVAHVTTLPSREIKSDLEVVSACRAKLRNSPQIYKGIFEGPSFSVRLQLPDLVGDRCQGRATSCGSLRDEMNGFMASSQEVPRALRQRTLI